MTLAVLTLCALVVGWHIQQAILDYHPPEPAAQTDIQHAISALPNGALVASNVPEVLWDATGRTSVVLPSRYDYLSNEINPRYDREVHDMASILARRHGYVYLAVTLTPTAGPVELERYANLVLLEQASREGLYLVEPRH